MYLLIFRVTILLVQHRNFRVQCATITTGIKIKNDEIRLLKTLHVTAY